MTHKAPIEKLLADLKPAMRQWLIAIHKSDTMITIRLRKNPERRVQLAEYINKHYNAEALLHGTFSLHIFPK